MRAASSLSISFSHSAALTSDGGVVRIKPPSQPEMATRWAQTGGHGGIGRRAALRTLFPLREWRFESSWPHHASLGLGPPITVIAWSNRIQPQPVPFSLRQSLGPPDPRSVLFRAMTHRDRFPSVNTTEPWVQRTPQADVSSQSTVAQNAFDRWPDYHVNSSRRAHHASAASIALSASGTPPINPAVATQCRGIRVICAGSNLRSSGVTGSGAELS